MIFETHAHYEDEKFDPDRAELLSSMGQKGIGRIINVGSSMETSEKSMALAHGYPFIYAAVGLHPDAVREATEENIDRLRAWSKDPKVVAIGEIGPDYHYEKDPEVRQLQLTAFRKQLDLALEAKLPVIVHSREAAKDTMEILTDFAKRGGRGVVHCYSYSPDQALQYVKMGFFIGVGGVITFKNGKKLRQTVEEIPMDHILLETDCPYMAPEPHRGERNSSLYIPYMVKAISMIKGISTEEVEDITWKNAMGLFTRVKDEE
jgi:TatD DNase family protein